ncbi:MAG TPA: hypothetical protein VKR58_10720, partial [Aquella sp.]|nr:hypothetical protein [Aquella sp.]
MSFFKNYLLRYTDDQVEDLKKKWCRNQHDIQILETAIKIKDWCSQYSEDHPAVVIQRKRMVQHMTSLLEEWLKKYATGSNIRLIVIRWFYTQQLLDYDAKDPLFPVSTSRNEGLWYEISRENVPHEEIPNFENFIQQLSCSFIEHTAGTKVCEHFQGDIEIDGDTVTINYSKYHNKISFNYFNKLKTLYVGKPDDFTKHLFNLINRYQTLFAPGYHASVPEKVFGVLLRELQLEHEIFASPFNNTLSNYTSAYPDTDKIFGSKGNFFEVYSDLFSAGGSFEANPPFLEEHMAALALIIEENLAREIPFSFVVIVPAWYDTLLYNIFMSSRYNILKDKYIYLNRHEHYYRNGAQTFIGPDTLRKSNSDTLVFILQNIPGEQKYP